MRVVRIVEGTSVDGPGLRTSIYFAGCGHRCDGCHNPETWDFNSGNEMNMDDVLRVVQYNNFPVTFSGGDPFFQSDQIVELAAAIKKLGFNIWCYTGFKYEYLAETPRYMKLLEYIDVLVDGRYEKLMSDISLPFRGSCNQRLIDVKKSLDSGNVVLYELNT